MCKSIQGFKSYVFCGSLPRSNSSCKMNLHCFSTGHGKGEWIVQVQL
jgi:hypothetical protein